MSTADCCPASRSSRASSVSKRSTISFAAPLYSDFPTTTLHDACDAPASSCGSKTSQKQSNTSCTSKKRSNKSLRSRRSSNLRPMQEECGELGVTCEESDCDGDFTASGSKPAKTAGALGFRYDSFAKYAPCGHWTTCQQAGCEAKICYEACKTCPGRTPYGPYGPWSKNGPAQFISPKADYIKHLYPLTKRRDGTQCKPYQPMGKLAPWPLSGSCRYAGRPYGACRPFGAYKSRGPFGVWLNHRWPEFLRPVTPAQPCCKPAKKGCRPCTPCHRPLFRPCKPTF